jgi:hypothetical protein
MSEEKVREIIKDELEKHGLLINQQCVSEFMDFFIQSNFICH